GVEVANLTHIGRGPSAAQRIALRWASPTCAVEGCNAVRTQVDHRLGWAETHHTRLDELDPLCKPHHDRKTYDGWALVEGTGKRAMVPPGDPPPSRPAETPGATAAGGRRRHPVRRQRRLNRSRTWPGSRSSWTCKAMPSRPGHHSTVTLRM